jgi:DNA-binding response OmpR family regulator
VIKPLAFVIEDDKHLAQIFATALQSAGFQSEVIHDGARALERLAAVEPVVVLLDLHLPKVMGRDVLRATRQDDRLANTKFILTTADPQMAKTLENDVEIVLIKPISFTQLRDLAARLRHALG